MIADTHELAALTLAYQLLNGLSRSIYFAIGNAERDGCYQHLGAGT